LGRQVSRREFLRALLTEMDKRQARLMKSELLQEWRNLSGTLNKRVSITSLDEEVTGQAVDIDATGALLVRSKDGSLKTVLVGDCVHLR
jgi:BirA family biotin operon repressor/biotin-[acetyl-CoA-carboxylase] ligase